MTDTLFDNDIQTTFDEKYPIEKLGAVTSAIKPTAQMVASVKNPTAADLDALGDLMAAVQDEITRYVQDLALRMNISEACAFDVYYLRKRSRWTQELEDALILLHKQGTPPNMNEFGCKKYDEMAR